MTMCDKGMPGANGVENFLLDLDEYTSPIKVMRTQIQTSIENDVFKAIEKYAIEVDKEELIKALAYDRDQYNKGYKDGVAACERRLNELFPKEVTHEAKPVVHAHWEEHREFYEDEGFEGYYYSCSNCGGTLYGDVEGFNFCHCCGAQMDELVSKADELNSLEKPNSCDHIAEGGKKENNDENI